MCNICNNLELEHKSERALAKTLWWLNFPDNLNFATGTCFSRQHSAWVEKGRF